MLKYNNKPPFHRIEDGEDVVAIFCNEHGLARADELGPSFAASPRMVELLKRVVSFRRFELNCPGTAGEINTLLGQIESSSKPTGATNA